MNEQRGSWYLLTGLILGIVAGLAIAWGLFPLNSDAVTPQSLRADYKDAYRAMIALAYDATQDLTRARSRLSLLQDEDPASVLAAQSQRYLAAGYSFEEAASLARLAVALGEAPAPAPRTPTAGLTTAPAETLTVSPTLEASDLPATEATASPLAEETAQPQHSPTVSPTPTLTFTPIPTFTPLPTRTPTPTLAPPYVLLSQNLVCDPDFGAPLIQVQVTNAAGEGVPGVEIIVQWEGGEDHFFTGLQPEIDPGYADFEMTPEVAYTLHIADGGEAVPLFVPECDDPATGRFFGSWYLVFTHP